MSTSEFIANAIEENHGGNSTAKTENVKTIKVSGKYKQNVGEKLTLVSVFNNPTSS